MTDLLTDEVNDTGEIRKADPGQTTRNLLPYLDLPPVLRRPTVEVPADGGGEGGNFQGPQPPPPPLPAPPPPAPKAEEVVWDRAPERPEYIGSHRAPARWFDPILDGLAFGWARIRGAM